MLGGAVGLLLAYGGVRAMVRFGPASIPRLETLSLDWRVAGVTLAVSLVTGILFGLVPALQGSGPNSAESLKEGSRSGSGAARQRVRGLLVISEFALSLLLLIGAGLMLRSFVALQAIDRGSGRTIFSPWSSRWEDRKTLGRGGRRSSISAGSHKCAPYPALSPRA
jgi:putative ABC transport system permease protein